MNDGQSTVEFDEVQRGGLLDFDPRQEIADKAHIVRVLGEAAAAFSDSSARYDRLSLFEDKEVVKALSRAWDDPKLTFDFYDALIGYLVGEPVSGTYGLLLYIYALAGLGLPSVTAALEDLSEFHRRSHSAISQQLRKVVADPDGYADSARFEAWPESTLNNVASYALHLAVERLYQLPPDERLNHLCHLLDPEVGDLDKLMNDAALVACRDAWKALALDDSGEHRTYSADHVVWPEAAVLAEAMLKPLANSEQPDESEELLLLAAAMRAIDPDSVERFKALVPVHRQLESHKLMLVFWERS